MKEAIIRTVAIILLIMTMTAEFCFSAEPADESQQTSDGFLFRISCIFYPELKTMTEAQRNEILERFSAPIRKLAHFSIYGLMGIFSLLSVASYKAFRPGLRYVAALIICALYAALDEFHQRFVPGRSCEIRDMLIDSSGALLGILFALCLMWLILKRGAKKNER